MRAQAAQLRPQRCLCARPIRPHALIRALLPVRLPHRAARVRPHPVRTRLSHSPAIFAPCCHQMHPYLAFRRTRPRAPLVSASLLISFTASAWAPLPSCAHLMAGLTSAPSALFATLGSRFRTLTATPRISMAINSRPISSTATTTSTISRGSSTTSRSFIRHASLSGARPCLISAL